MPKGFRQDDPSYCFDLLWMPEPTTGCFIWLGGVSGYGHGRFRLNGRLVYAHRFAYEREHGPIPEGMVIDHVQARGCSTPACVNVEHMEVVTRKVNTNRGRTHAPDVVARRTATRMQRFYAQNGGAR